MQDLGLFVANRVRLERNRRFHRGEANKLHDVIGHHVAQGASCIVIIAALFDADGFGNRNLHVVDVAAIPYRLENSVGEAEGQDILDRLFSQVVIDAVDLALRNNAQQLLVQGLGGIEIVPEGFFDDYASPIVIFGHQTRFRKSLDDIPKILSRRGEIKEIIAVRFIFLVNFGKHFFQLVICGRIVKVSVDVTYATDKPFPKIGIDFAGGEFLEVFRHLLARLLIAHGASTHADDGKLRSQ